MAFLLNSSKGSTDSIEYLSDSALYLWGGSNNSVVANSNVYTLISGQYPAAEQGFGTNIAMAANRIIIRSRSGNTAVYSLDTGTVIHRPDNKRVAGDYYNKTLAVMGDKMVLASGDGVSNVYLLNNSYSSTLSFNTTVVADTGFNTSGFSVAAADNRIVVGMPRDLSGGQVRVFNYNEEMLFDIISPGGGGLINYFGDVVSIGNGIIAVGTPYSDAAGTFNAGAVDLFDYNGNFIKKILPAIKTSNGNFGGAVSIGSGVIAVSYLGPSVFDIYDLTGSKITSINTPNIPISIKVKYGKIFVGIPDTPANKNGRVYVYNLRGALLQIIAPSMLNNARFGSAIDVGYGYLAVSANSNSVSGTTNSGSVLVYKINPAYTIEDAEYITYNGD
jgi:hypothetical protein